MANDVLIANGLVIDGSGRPAVRGDVVVRDGRIEDVGIFPSAEAAKVIDADGLAVAPGFIDTHAHLDWIVASPRHPEILESWVRQGVTTLVVGVDGFAPAPMNDQARTDIDTYWSFSLPRDGLQYEWSTMAELLQHMEKMGQTLNVGMLTGHNVIRANVFGFQARPPNGTEMSEMKTLLKQSLAEGSIGFSVGLYYCPGTFSDMAELMELASVCTEFNVPLVAHTRGLTVTYDKAVEEVVHVCEENRIPLHISHHAGGDLGGGNVRPRALEAIRQAQERGVRITHDNIPWLVGPTAALALLPPRLFDGGCAAALKRLTDPAARDQAATAMREAAPQWPTWEHEYWTDKFFGADLRFSGFRNTENRRFENMSLGSVAEASGKNVYETFFDILLAEEGKLFFIGGVFDHPVGDEVMGQLLADPYCCVMTDVVGAGFKPPNAVAYGAFPKVLGLFARDKGLMTQEEAIRKMTSLAANAHGFKDRGLLKKGAFADITVFNPRTVRSRATFADPYQHPEGIEYVLVNGKIVLEKGSYNADALAGKVIRRS